jgi:hypothetical protein
MYAEHPDLANDLAKAHIERLIAEADAERLAKAYAAGHNADNKEGVTTWLINLVKPSRISARRV